MKHPEFLIKQVFGYFYGICIIWGITIALQIDLPESIIQCINGYP
jgi:hypothetical protein